MLISGLHDVRIPVRDPWASRDWYMTVLGFESVLDLQEARGLAGVVLQHPSGAVLGLHQDARRCRALTGFVLVAMTVPDRAELTTWVDALDRMDQVHSTVQEGHLGWYVDLPDPDGILIRLHTATRFDAEEA